MKKILCLGHASFDITIPVLEFPEENTKIRVNERVECGGGPSANAAYLLGKWGANVYFSGSIGDDLFGTHIVNELKSVNVNVDYLEKGKNRETTTSYIVANIESGSRTILTYRKDNYEIENVSFKEKFDVLLIDGQEYKKSKELLLSNNKPSISIIDAGRNTSEVVELAKMVDYLVCSKKFAESFTGVKIDLNDKESIHEVYVIMEKNFKNKVVITLEEHGSLYSIDNKIKLMPALKVPAKDTTGAGDIFHGAFTYAIANDFLFEDALKLATIAASVSVMRVGGRNSILDLKDIMEIYEQKNG